MVKMTGKILNFPALSRKETKKGIENSDPGGAQEGGAVIIFSGIHIQPMGSFCSDEMASGNKKNGVRRWHKSD
ncbi:MAG: hypothetical protein PSN37_00910 [Alphaproteobacteria bacterium]|nr:hypothetical protein [Alphaproteobacteria bacterium]